MGRQQRAQIEAFYMISHGKSPEEIQYTVEGDRAKRITQARGEVSGTMTYINSALAGSAHGAIAGYAFCMAPYAAPALLYGTGAGYAGSMVGLSEAMMISLTETALYALNFSNIVVQGSDMVESTTGENALRDALGDDLYRMVGQVSETGATVTVIAGLSNPDYYVKNNQAAHFEQVPRAGTDTIIRDGKIAIDDIKANPSAFSGKSAEEIADILRNSGYDTTIKTSTRSRSGAQIIQINNLGGEKNISQVQVSPGGGRHGSNPYVKISTTDQGIIKIVDGVESTYRTDGKETATIIFSGGN